MNPRRFADPEDQAEYDRMVLQSKCDHDFGDMCTWTFMGCTRTCRKCKLMTCDPNHCGQYDARTTSAKP